MSRTGDLPSGAGDPGAPGPESSTPADFGTPPRSPPGPSLHRLEQMKVLLSRYPFNFLRERQNKEWWYTGAYDRKTGVYISWYFIRVNVLDKLVLTIFNPKTDSGPVPRLIRTCRLDTTQIGEGLFLRASAKGFRVAYQLEPSGEWAFALESGTINAHVRIKQTYPAFTKFDNEMEDRYAIIHYFHNVASGAVEVAGGKSYQLSNALVYQDHCYGRVPRRTGWHWIAVQSRRVALTVLVNYGAYAQRFAHVWLTPTVEGPPRPGSGRWVRLEQNVSFEREDPDTVKGKWFVTSTDLDLEIEPQRVVSDQTKVPFLVNLSHSELFVAAKGRVRVDGQWVETGAMHGVMEQHHGRW